jgi:hypothetical protein
MENRLKRDGLRSWYHLVKQYETESNRNVRIKKLENVIATVYHAHYRRGLLKWIKDYKDDFTEIFYLERRYGMMMVVRTFFCSECPEYWHGGYSI